MTAIFTPSSLPRYKGITYFTKNFGFGYNTALASPTLSGTAGAIDPQTVWLSAGVFGQTFGLFPVTEWTQ